MKTVQAICETYLMYACFFALAMIVGVFTLAYCWKQLRRIFSLGSIQGTFVSIIVIFLTLYGGSKSLFKFEKGLKDDGSYSTNDTVYVSWIKSGEVYDIPNDSTLYVEKRLSTDTEGEFVPFHTNTVGAYELTLNVLNATNYDYNIWYAYTPTPVSEKSWYAYYTKHASHENDILPLKATVIGIEGNKKYILNSITSIDKIDIPTPIEPDGEKKKNIKCLVDGNIVQYDGMGHGPFVTVTDPTSGAVVEYSTTAYGPWVDSLLFTNVIDVATVFCKISADGYNTVTQGVICSVTPGEIKFTELGHNFTYAYDGTLHGITGHITTPQEGGIVEYSDYINGPWHNTQIGYKEAGQYMSYIRYSAENYATTTTAHRIEITKFPVTFNSSDYTKLYDSIPLTNSPIFISRQDFPTREGFTIKPTGYQKNAGSSPSSFDVIPNEVTKLTNYEITKTYGELIVNPRHVFLTSASESKMYNGIALTNTSPITISGDGFANGEGATYQFTGYQLESGSSPNFFDYTLNENTLPQNYNIQQQYGMLTVKPSETKLVLNITTNTLFVFGIGGHPYNTAHIDYGDGTDQYIDLGDEGITISDMTYAKGQYKLIYHEYKSLGEYTVTIDDNITDFIASFALEVRYMSSTNSFHGVLVRDIRISSSAISKCISYGNAITNLALAYAGCTGLTGNIPAWGANVINASSTYWHCPGLTGNIPAWGANITNASSTYSGCTGLTGNIPAWGANITECSYTYEGCTGLTGAWTDNVDELMPSRITFYSHRSCVSNTSESLRALFYSSWGGTKEE